MSADAVRRYHDGTKHHFHAHARSLGYLDWASQPDPFRSYAGATGVAVRGNAEAPAVARLLRYSLGLSAWKSFRGSRWSLRVNPSSGNLHPTEAYIVAGRGAELAAGIYHYAPDRHALEQRCEFDDGPPGLMVALTSIHWREAWKYGERAFRYCQHDIGHAIAAIGYAAALEGRCARIVAPASHAAVAALTGVDRDEDFVEAEREDPACLLALADGGPAPDVAAFVAAARAGRWHGRASQLSVDHVQWTFIDEIAAATVNPGHEVTTPAAGGPSTVRADAALPSRDLLLRRRSAVAFDGATATSRDRLEQMLAAAMPDASVPFEALWWTPRVHLALFVHRVDGVAPGLYALPRTPEALDRLKHAFRGDFLWERASDRLPLFLLAGGDCRRAAQRLSCDQDIAADGFFSLGMIAEFDASLEAFGPAFYRHLFWEAGAVGQSLYLAAEAAGARGTGIGCFYDDPVHDLLGLRDHAFQSLYHFTIGMPVEDTRLTTEPGYRWEESGEGA